MVNIKLIFLRLKVFKIILQIVSLLWVVSTFSVLKADFCEAKIQKEEWTCSDCGEENPFWYTLCGSCGKFYW